MKILYTTEAIVEGGRAGRGRPWMAGSSSSCPSQRIGGEGGPGTIQSSFSP